MLVAIEVGEGGKGAREYYRIGAQVEGVDVLYNPFLLVPSEKKFLAELEGEYLEGEGLDRLIEFEKWNNFYEARKILHASQTDHIAYASPAKNYLARKSKRMFTGGKFDDIVRLVIDIETTGLNARENELLLIAYASNRGDKGVFIANERLMLSALNTLVRDVDPDVIEGHNILGFDLPFLFCRASLHEIPLLLGRNETAPRFGRKRNIAIGPNSKLFEPCYIYGRHVIDTYLAVQRYDVAGQKLSSYGLKECARVFGIAEEERIELDRERMQELFEEDRERVTTYALQDVQETLDLAAIVLPAEFYQTQIVPDSYQGVCTTGNGERVNSIMVSEYLQRGHAIPHRSSAEDYVGGYVEARRKGVFYNVVKADVESLYPTLMLTQEIKSEKDELNVMLPLLSTLKEQRLRAKGLAKTSKQEVDKAYWDGYQNAYKILINSMYGYMAGPFHFNDYTAAMRVTMAGRELVKKIADGIEKHGGEVIEIDTDGVIFSMKGALTSRQAEKFIEEVAREVLPEGITLAHDGSYQAMLSLKAKNYVLLAYDGKLTIKGASLKNRNSEKFGQEFLRECIRTILAGERDRISNLYGSYLEKFLGNDYTPNDISRRERISEKVAAGSLQKARLREVSEEMELDVGDYIYVYEKDDGTLAPISQYNNDANLLYYLQKLHKYLSRFSSFWEAEEFKRLFPKPGKRWLEQIKKIREGKGIENNGRKQ